MLWRRASSDRRVEIQRRVERFSMAPVGVLYGCAEEAMEMNWRRRVGLWLGVVLVVIAIGQAIQLGHPGYAVVIGLSLGAWLGYRIGHKRGMRLWKRG